MATTRSPRSVTFADRDKPIYAVWEITLRCNQACAHCGSRAGPTEERPDELSTAELLEVAAELVRLGTREVTLIGGEAYLRDDIFDIVHFLSAQGIRVTMQTGGRGLSPRLAKALKDAGMKAVGVSVDGPEEIHDVLRDSVGS
ncbi:MAG: radical SAM protein [Deltaproteobacteria bacterium]|nr:radical SAM protein [Deltaproteobacteria bacterium]